MDASSGGRSRTAASSKPTGTFWLAIGDEYAAELKLIFQRELGFTCRSWVIWYYTFGVNCTKKFSRSHAHLFHFVMDPKNYTFNDLDIRVPSARQLVYADARADARGRLPDDTWITSAHRICRKGFSARRRHLRTSAVCAAPSKGARCPAVARLPDAGAAPRPHHFRAPCSNPGDAVLDPFGGSGTTLVVAKKLGRRFIGFELSPNYAAQSQARLDGAVEGQPLKGAEEPKR